MLQQHVEMAVWLIISLATAAFAQLAPDRVNVTAGDGTLTVGWSLPTADTRIESFTGWLRKRR